MKATAIWLDNGNEIDEAIEQNEKRGLSLAVPEGEYSYGDVYINPHEIKRFNKHESTIDKKAHITIEYKDSSSFTLLFTTGTWNELIKFAEEHWK